MAPRNHERADEYGVPLPIDVAASSDGSTFQASDPGSSNTEVGYFAQRGIVAGPSDDFNSLFKRLAIQEGMSKTQRRKRRNQAIAAEMDAAYGTDVTKLEKWQELCRDVKIEPVPQSITQCKKALSKVWINLVNLIDHRRNRNVQLIIFPGYKQFCKYTIGDGKAYDHIFPKELAKKEGFIRALLRKLPQGY
ncbi:uncharacterized protein EKO05_0004897 [Ascochyta rabiei]|uniref:Uncharacterized protein n=1 Tax=Didymella rabiei TaxID=5454 RepID=A0A163LKM0_DIDRA|nr:uncharacterized protein EKO05_0004897 [Ascochyta rabiei]KZM27873.1 hypothetical protein ST47_g991 [Ascochyta rabiei]UPX14415.1 hypothetical protein EKO05_0004897 [Ascochyta rabiei]